MRSAAIGLLLIIGLLFVACDPGIEITFVNNTDRDLCCYESDFETPRPGDLDASLCGEIAPHQKVDYGTICQSDWLKWVILTVGTNGPQIYARVATCGEWEDSGATVTIEQVDGEIVVADSLPDVSPTP
jgi:hypothetical protein